MPQKISVKDFGLKILSGGFSVESFLWRTFDPKVNKDNFWRKILWRIFAHKFRLMS